MSTRIKRGYRPGVPTRERIEPAEIVSVRKRLKMSQTQFAAALGMPVKTLRHWEQGSAKPSSPGPLRLAFRCLLEHGSRR